VAGGEIDPTQDGVRLRIDKLAESLNQPTDAAFSSDGRLFIAEALGRIRVFRWTTADRSGFHCR
jgi:hypothetical protein